MSAERAPPHPGVPPPRIVVVGCGAWGRNHVRTYAGLGALAAVVDDRPEIAQAQGEAHGVPAMSYQAALSDPAIDAVVLALPPARHAPLATQALEAGKHVFVEKPMALTTDDASALCAAAERADRRLMVGHILQYHPAFLALAGLVRTGALGPLMRIVSTRLNLGRIRREEDALWALAPHDVSMALALVGGEPVTVAASAGCHTHPTIADVASVELGFPGGVGAEIRVSWLHPYKEQRLVAIGRDAMAVFDDGEPWERKLVVYRHRIVDRGGVVETVRAEAEPVALAPAEPLGAECLHFLDSIRTGIAPRTDGREGLRVLDVLERARAALLAAGQSTAPLREGLTRPSETSR